MKYFSAVLYSTSSQSDNIQTQKFIRRPVYFSKRTYSTRIFDKKKLMDVSLLLNKLLVEDRSAEEIVIRELVEARENLVAELEEDEWLRKELVETTEEVKTNIKLAEHQLQKFEDFFNELEKEKTENNAKKLKVATREQSKLLQYFMDLQACKTLMSEKLQLLSARTQKIKFAVESLPSEIDESANYLPEEILNMQQIVAETKSLISVDEEEDYEHDSSENDGAEAVDSKLKMP